MADTPNQSGQYSQTGVVSKGWSSPDLTLQKALNRIMPMRNILIPNATSVAVTWADLWDSLDEKCRKVQQAGVTIDATQIIKTEMNNGQVKTTDYLAGIREELKPGGVCAETGLTEGEAAAVLLYTAAAGVDTGAYRVVNTTLRHERSPAPHGVFIATLVSALRKLRAQEEQVACVRRWTGFFPDEGDGDYVTAAFLSATCCMNERPTTVEGSQSFIILPRRRRAAVVPECLTFHPNEKEVIFEPGTAFRRITFRTYEELPYTYVDPKTPPLIEKVAFGTNKKVNILKPASQCMLLYPVGIAFTQLVPKEPSGDPPAKHK